MRELKKPHAAYLVTKRIPCALQESSLMRQSGRLTPTRREICRRERECAARVKEVVIQTIRLHPNHSCLPGIDAASEAADSIQTKRKICRLAAAMAPEVRDAVMAIHLIPSHFYLPATGVVRVADRDLIPISLLKWHAA